MSSRFARANRSSLPRHFARPAPEHTRTGTQQFTANQHASGKDVVLPHEVRRLCLGTKRAVGPRRWRASESLSMEATLINNNKSAQGVEPTNGPSGLCCVCALELFALTPRGDGNGGAAPNLSASVRQRRLGDMGDRLSFWGTEGSRSRPAATTETVRSIGRKRVGGRGARVRANTHLCYGERGPLFVSSWCQAQTLFL